MSDHNARMIEELHDMIEYYKRRMEKAEEACLSSLVKHLDNRCNELQSRITKAEAVIDAARVVAPYAYFGRIGLIEAIEEYDKDKL